MRTETAVPRSVLFRSSGTLLEFPATRNHEVITMNVFFIEYAALLVILLLMAGKGITNGKRKNKPDRTGI